MESERQEAVDVILDCDTGTDDAVAIMLAALAPALHLRAVTTVRGNVSVDVVAENTLRVLQHVGAGEVPVYLGSGAPLDRADFPVAREHLIGFEIQGTYLNLKAAESSTAGDAVEYLIAASRASRRSGEAVTLIATGPLTNLAHAVRADPDFTVGIGHLIIMGGGHAFNNVTPSAEFNFWADPEAAKLVMGAGFPRVTLVPLDATHQALVTWADCQSLRRLGTPAAMATAELIEQRITGHDLTQPMPGGGSATLHDAVCVALLLDPDVVAVEDFYVDVETHGVLTVGRSVIDVHRRSRREPNCRVAVAADKSRFLDVLLDVFAVPDE
jgi:inosine-uridine nucleoside N-ribohydrolase